MNIDTAWKVLSITLTGAFGILGLVKDFKDKKGKITKWGRVSLAGILLSTGLGVVFQTRESSKAAEAERETGRQTLRIVRDIQRGLAPLDEPRFNISFSLACDLPSFNSFCHDLVMKGPYATYADKVWPNWPAGRPSMFLTVDLFADSNEAKPDSLGRMPHGNMRFILEPTTIDGTLFAYVYGDGVVTLGAQDAKPGKDPVSVISDGKLRSILDMPGLTVVLNAFNTHDPDYVVPRVFNITFKNGEFITYNGPMEKLKLPLSTYFRFTLPK